MSNHRAEAGGNRRGSVMITGFVTEAAIMTFRMRPLCFRVFVHGLGCTDAVRVIPQMNIMKQLGTSPSRIRTEPDSGPLTESCQ